MQIGLLLEMVAEGAPDRVVVGARAGGMTAAELLRRSRAVAASFAASGGERIGFVDVNSEALPIALFGAAMAGLPFAPVNYRLADDELDAILRRLAPGLVVVGPDVAARIRAIDGLEIVARDDLLAISSDGDRESARGGGFAVRCRVGEAGNAERGRAPADPGEEIRRERGDAAHEIVPAPQPARLPVDPGFLARLEPRCSHRGGVEHPQRATAVLRAHRRLGRRQGVQYRAVERTGSSLVEADDAQPRVPREPIAAARARAARHRRGALRRCTRGPVPGVDARVTKQCVRDMEDWLVRQFRNA